MHFHFETQLLYLFIQLRRRTALSKCSLNIANLGASGREPGDLSILDKELGKVPVDVRDRGLGVLFEVFPDRLSVFAINVALLGNRKSHSIVELTELKNLIIGPRLLSLKLVARETNDCQSLITILLVQSLEILVLRSQTTLARNIDKQESLALQVTKGKSGLGKLNRVGVAGGGTT